MTAAVDDPKVTTLLPLLDFFWLKAVLLRPLGFLLPPIFAGTLQGGIATGPEGAKAA